MRTREQVEAEAVKAALSVFENRNEWIDGPAEGMQKAMEAYEAALWMPISEAPDETKESFWVHDAKKGVKEATLSFGNWCYEEYGQAFGTAYLENPTHFRYPPKPPEST
jgi:hypothetical protein